LANLTLTGEKGKITKETIESTEEKKGGIRDTIGNMDTMNGSVTIDQRNEKSLSTSTG